MPADPVTGELPVPGGRVRATIVPGDGRNQIASVRFEGPFQAAAGEAREKLEGALAGATIDEAPGRIEDFFAGNPGALAGVEPEDLLTVLTLAFMKARKTVSAAPDPEDWKKGT